MDWNRIEKDVKSRTASILVSKSQDSSRIERSYDDYPRYESRDFNVGNSLSNNNRNIIHQAPSNYRENYRETNLISQPAPLNYAQCDMDEISSEITNQIEISQRYLLKEIADLRNIITKQNDKIRRLEKQDIEESKSSNYEILTARIDALETEQSNFNKNISNLTRENEDICLTSKTIYNRLQFLDDLCLSATQEYVTKSSFTKLLDTCLSELKSINVVVENSRNSSNQSMLFVEMLLYAFSEMQGGDRPAFRLDNIVDLLR